MEQIIDNLKQFVKRYSNSAAWVTELNLQTDIFRGITSEKTFSICVDERKVEVKEFPTCRNFALRKSVNGETYPFEFETSEIL